VLGAKIGTVRSMYHVRSEIHVCKYSGCNLRGGQDEITTVSSVVGQSFLCQFEMHTGFCDEQLECLEYIYIDAGRSVHDLVYCIRPTIPASPAYWQSRWLVLQVIAAIAKC